MTLMHKGRHPGCGCISDNYNIWLLYHMLLAELDDHIYDHIYDHITQWPRVLNVTQNRVINAFFYSGL